MYWRRLCAALPSSQVGNTTMHYELNMPGIKKARKQREMHKNAPLSRRNIKSFFWIRPNPRMSKSGTVIKDQFQFQIQFFCSSHVQWLKW